MVGDPLLGARVLCRTGQTVEAGGQPPLHFSLFNFDLQPPLGTLPPPLGTLPPPSVTLQLPAGTLQPPLVALPVFKCRPIACQNDEVAKGRPGGVLFVLKRFVGGGATPPPPLRTWWWCSAWGCPRGWRASGKGGLLGDVEVEVAPTYS